MLKRTALLLLVLALTLTVVACAATPPEEPPVQGEPPATSDPGTGDPAAGLRLAPGLYDLDNGTVQALGTLAWVELEGGFYAIKGPSETGAGDDSILAVIANGGDFTSELEPLVDTTVLVTGTRFDGVSIRQAGPEILITSVEAISDTPGAAE